MSPHRPRHRPHTAAAPRSGFSLIELLAVMVIIALLVAMLLPAIGAVRSRANLAQVSVDIKALETGISTFKTEFGSEPPSRIVLYEQPTGDPSWAVDSSNPLALTRSKSLIRKLWPQFNFAIARDINGNGTATDRIELNGAECLVFFLGGVNATNYVDANGNPFTPAPTGAVGEWIPLGFSKNPRDPFERSGGTRVGPMTELDASRFVDFFGDSMSPTTSDGMPELLDPFPSQTRPYVYASSYDGKGYDATDLFGTGMTSVYLQKLGASPPVGNVPWNKTSYQIISPGIDGEYGTGGLFEVGDSYIIPTGRSNERDNVTNFSGGTLN
jgi:prepilin-type N-terminal cleavage/methylation domain-containing protein